MVTLPPQFRGRFLPVKSAIFGPRLARLLRACSVKDIGWVLGQMYKISIIFLGFVSFEYYVLGIIGLVGLLIQSEPLFVLDAFTSYSGLVAPLAIVHRYGAQALCGFGPGCNLDAFTIRYAQVVVGILSVLAIIGGILSFWGTVLMAKKKNTGYRIWLFFVGLSIAVALWNLKWFMFDSFSSNPFIGPTSAVWALLYGVAYIFAAREFKERPEANQQAFSPP